MVEANACVRVLPQALRLHGVGNAPPHHRVAAHG